MDFEGLLLSLPTLFQDRGKTDRETPKTWDFLTYPLLVKDLRKRNLDQMEGILSADGFALPSGSQNQTAVEN